MILKANAAGEIPFFMPSASDPWVGVTGLTASSFTVSVIRPGQSISTVSSPSITELGSGWYRFVVPANTYGAGAHVFLFEATGAKKQQVLVQFVEFNPYSNTDITTLTNNIASATWSSSTRTLTSFGTLVDDIKQAVWSYTVESTYSALQFLRWMGAVLFGNRVVSNERRTFYGLDGTTVRVDGTVDANGNRTITTRQ